MAYATAATLRTQINKTSTADDATLTTLISAAERNINRFCNRPDGFEADSSASARRYAGSGKPYQFVDECVEITLVEVKDSATDTSYDSWTSADWIAARGDPEYPNYNETPYDLIIVDPTGDESIFTSGKYTVRGGFRPITDVSRGVPTVRITAKWGFSVSVPADISEACIMQAAIWYKELEGAMGPSLVNTELGQIVFQKPIHPSIKRILVDGRYVKPTTGRR